MPDRILMIEDDARLAAMVAEYLAPNGLEVTVAGTAAAGLRTLADGGGSIRAVLLDVMLPDGDGFDVCRRIRAKSDVPVLMLTARGDDADRIVGLELGADDYLPKPFNPRELLARLRAILRRRTGGATSGPEAAPARPPLRFGTLEIDREARVVRVNGEERALTGHQFDILALLAERAGRVQSREALMQALRGQEQDAFDRSIDVHISRIRAAIEEDPKRPRRILTIRGTGYVFARDDRAGRA